MSERKHLLSLYTSWDPRVQRLLSLLAHDAHARGCDTVCDEDFVRLEVFDEWHELCELMVPVLIDSHVVCERESDTEFRFSTKALPFLTGHHLLTLLDGVLQEQAKLGFRARNIPKALAIVFSDIESDCRYFEALAGVGVSISAVLFVDYIRFLASHSCSKYLLFHIIHRRWALAHTDDASTGPTSDFCDVPSDPDEIFDNFVHCEKLVDLPQLAKGLIHPSEALRQQALKALQTASTHHCFAVFRYLCAQCASAPARTHTNAVFKASFVALSSADTSFSSIVVPFLSLAPDTIAAAGVVLLASEVIAHGDQYSRDAIAWLRACRNMPATAAVAALELAAKGLCLDDEEVCSDVLSALSAQLSHKEVHERHAAAVAIGTFLDKPSIASEDDATKLVEELMGVFQRSYQFKVVQEAACMSLGAVARRWPAVVMRDESVMQSLIDTSGDAYWEVRAAKVAALGCLGLCEQRVVDALMAALKENDIDVRIAAVEALIGNGLQDQRVEAVLRAGLGHPSMDIRHSVLRILFDPSVFASSVSHTAAAAYAKRLLPETVLCLADDQVSHVHNMAKLGLADHPGQAVAHVLNVFNGQGKQPTSRDLAIVASAARHLTYSDEAAAKLVPLLRLDHTEKAVRTASVLSLRNSSLFAAVERNPEELSRFLFVLDDSEWEVAEAAFSVIIHRETTHPYHEGVLERLVPVLCSFLDSDDSLTQVSSMTALQAIGPACLSAHPGAANAVLSCLEDSSWRLRLSTVKTMASLFTHTASPTSLKALVSCIQNDAHWTVRAAAMHSFVVIAASQPTRIRVTEAFEACVCKWLAHEDEEVRAASARTLALLLPTAFDVEKVRAIASLAEGDRSHLVRAAAASALASSVVLASEADAAACVNELRAPAAAVAVSTSSLSPSPSSSSAAIAVGDGVAQWLYGPLAAWVEANSPTHKPPFTVADSKARSVEAVFLAQLLRSASSS